MRFGEEPAALIPGSRLVALSSNNHLLTAGESAWQVFRAEVDAFLAGEATTAHRCPQISTQSPHILMHRRLQRFMLVT